MLRIITFLFCTLGSPLLALCGGETYFNRLTPDQTAQLEAEANGIAYGKGTLWQATRGAVQITLIGTMHINDPRLNHIHAKIRDTVQAADLILLEATPAEEAQVLAYMSKNADILFIQDGPTLPERLDAATWDKVMEAVRAHNIPPFLAAKFEPWYLMMALAIPPCAMQDIANGVRGLDHMIMDDAMAADVPLQALEPFDTLFKVLQSGDSDDQLEMLKLALMSGEDQLAMFTALLDSYFTQDIGKLIALNRFLAENTPDLDPVRGRQMALDAEDVIIGNRNRAWMPVIDAAAAQNTNIVVAVGAAHLPDTHGLLNLLQLDGWTISPF